jgi:uncharacterized protein (DUF427 family)
MPGLFRELPQTLGPPASGVSVCLTSATSLAQNRDIRQDVRAGILLLRWERVGRNARINPVMAKATEMVEGNLYFPESSLKREYFRPSSTISTCPWKGQARYYSLLVDGQENQDAAWYYPDPKPAARNVKNHVAFWRGVEVEK